MGTKGIEIAGSDVQKTIVLLNKALADEWLAYYQYWIGAKVAKGKMRPAIVAELVEHAGDELRHAQMVADRIISLGGTPIIDFSKLLSESNCGYDAPSDFNTNAIVKQNVKGEQCAIDVYNKLALATKDKDIITYNMVIEIMEDEIEHEEDLQAILEDMQT